MKFLGRRPFSFGISLMLIFSTRLVPRLDLVFFFVTLQVLAYNSNCLHGIKSFNSLLMDSDKPPVYFMNTVYSSTSMSKTKAWLWNAVVYSCTDCLA
ncbi:hypothetical protein GIB67_022588 [Kingdonia uniflora]|uniref:Uncharacterized protein n=1 Tax=Kingdonia uniflora TaxID=39325 RepID=A0A7J7L7L3_9MAGN|nr:hypothetical protein GIB67_022588 [Kingdonia uniflora]